MSYSDKELADAVVALGVGSLLPAQNKHGCHVRSYAWYEINDDEFLSGSTAKSASVFVRDWRVAGALMEKVDQIDTQPLISIERGKVEVLDVYSGINSEVENESLPRAVIEATVEALK